MNVRKRIAGAVLALVMLLSLACPALAAESSALEGYQEETILHRSDLAVIAVRLAGLEDQVETYAQQACPFTDVPADADYVGYVNAAYAAGLLSGTGAGVFSPDAVVTQEQAATVVLRHAGLKNSQLGGWPYDYNQTAESMGLTKGFTYEAAAPVTAAQMDAMIDNSAALYHALHSETKTPLFVDGMAQPIFDYDEAVRFCVYVETNYDTDGDGKLDLVKALVQLPKEVMEGDFQAATIYEARPYITGCTPWGEEENQFVEGGYDIAGMYAQPAARTPAGVMTTADAAAQADSDDWYYWNPYEEMYDYEDLTWYDYYLVRGFAVVECGGLGTKGSEGFETCGSDLEIDAFKCVIEWLHGDRVAYTDLTSNVEIKADWSNGKVGMTGRSYAGTTQFGLATTGVAGLETIVPVAGIASWYEYTNSQGVSFESQVSYTETLAFYCAGRYLDDEDYASIQENYGKYLYQLKLDQEATNGDYSDHWANRDYTLNWENIQCPALIVHGLNDDNVKTKQFDLMYQAYEKSGQPVKLLLHQGTHLTPTYPSHETEMYIDDQMYDAILNQWFSHYLYGVDNGIENMAKVTAQSNVDGSWTTYDSWTENTKELVLKCADSTQEATTTVSSDLNALEITRQNWREIYTGGPTASSAMYTMDVAEDTTISGSVAVHITASSDAAADGQMVSAMLVDLDENGFMTYTAEGSYLPENVLLENGAWMGGGLDNFDLVEFAQTEAAYKIIARGWMDLCNPASGYDSSTAAESIELVPGENHEYTLYLQPNLYTVKAGHTLALVIYTYEPGSYPNPDLEYNITIDNAATYAVIPVR